MADIIIRGLPDGTKEKLRVLAAESGLSLESYARQVLQQASIAGEFRSANLLDLAERYFGAENGVELVLPPRQSNREPVRFEE